MSHLSLDPPTLCNLQEATISSFKIKSATVVVVDDHALVRAAISHVLSSQGIKRLALARDYSEAEVETAQLHPDIIWLDMHILHSPNDGITEIARLKKISPESRIIVVTDVEDEHEAFAAVMMGAQAYCSKQDIDPGEVMSLICMVCSGETVLRPVLMTRVMHRIRTAVMPIWGPESSLSDHVILRKRELCGIEQLTTREREVLQFISQGSRDRDIAKRLQISEKTVQKHVQNVLGKLGVQNRTEAAYLIHQQTVS